MAAASDRNQRPAKSELRKQVAELEARLALQDEALRAGEHRLRLALGAGRMGTWEWIITSGEVIWSPTLEVIHGRTPGGFAGTFQAVLEEVHPDDRARVAEAIAATLREGTEYHVEYRIVLPDGALRWVEARGLVFSDESGVPERMMGVCSDITERKRSEEAVRQNLKLESLSVLAGGIAHDFNNLLTSVIGNASLLLDLAAQDGPDRDLLAAIVQSGERAAELTRQLLAYAGKGTLFKKAVDLTTLLRHIRVVLLPLIPSAIELRLDLPPDLPAIHADPSQLEQVVRSLVMNAVEAIGEGRAGRVLLRTGVHDVEKDCVFFEVSDTGKHPVNSVPGTVAAAVASMAIPSIQGISVWDIVCCGESFTRCTVEDCEVLWSGQYLTV
jgi:PAS domain S-box-containing protein